MRRIQTLIPVLFIPINFHRPTSSTCDFDQLEKSFGGYNLKIGSVSIQFVIKYLHCAQFFAIRLNMINNTITSESLLKELGARLKEARLSRNESQELFAQRLGITRQSYSKMEQGSPQTPIGNWVAASSILGRIESWRDVLAEQEDLFTQFERKVDKRQRAGGRRKG